MKPSYVVGFYFVADNHGSRVVLIRKNKPEWQRGKLNGVGGRIEPGESPIQAMQREFREEAGVHIDKWRHFASLESPNRTIRFFDSYGSATGICSCTAERIEFHSVQRICNRTDVVPNLKWLIPLARSNEALVYIIQ